MFSITGLEFAYSQAPLSMKSVCQSAWLMTVAVGNLVVVVVSGATLFPQLSTELFFYSVLMAAATLVFACLSMSYVYVSTDEAVEPPSGEFESAKQ